MPKFNLGRCGSSGQKGSAEYTKDVDNLTGSVERITYYNPENGYTVLRLRPEDARRHAVPGLGSEDLLTVVGNLPELSPGEHLKLQGKWDTHPTHGKQFKVEICEQTLPSSAAGIEGYLGSGLIRGIGPKLAERIVAVFQERTFEIIEQDSVRLLEISGIGQDRMGRITAAWEEQKQVKEIMIFLHGHGVSTNLAVKIYKTYGDRSLEVVRKDPYQLERDIYGVGFKTADRIAQALGLAPDHPTRIEAGIVFALNEMIHDGHVYSPMDLLAEKAIELLEVVPDLIAPALERLRTQDRIRIEEIFSGGSTVFPRTREKVIYLTPLYFGEIGVADRFKKLVSSAKEHKLTGQLVFPDESLSPEQQAAVQMALGHAVTVLTGGPGTGKTTCLKALITNLEALHISYALASPTGRAAKRLSEATSRPASTIHRLLEFSPVEGFKFNTENPLKKEFLVVDEASMLDLLLTHHLLKALRPGTHLLLVGDVDQLPSVGAGDVLRDIIASGIVPVANLTTIFRQAADSQIIMNSHRINQGKQPVFSSESGDFFLFPAEDAAAAADWIVELVSGRIPRKFGFDSVRDIQVLSPIYRGAAGVTMLNERLQETLNPPASEKSERRLFGVIFRIGDKVMQTRNNYDKEVYNGDIGYVKKIDPFEHVLAVDFEGRSVSYDWNEVDELTLAYAVSVHKAQGSEFPVVVMPLVTGHYMMLQRNLLYTAITRARKLCVLAGSRRAISMAVRNNKVTQRFTALEWRLEEGPLASR
ncbi:MAG: ATP-dependent RecD-like DNA helicase [Chloroflexi bacterium]|nr:ATP-dependent RecD-like DNA helicase [Chloroflexota bacterium]